MSNTTDQKPDANANFADVASELAAALATAEDAAQMDLPMGDAKAPSLPVGIYGQGVYGECRWLTKEEIAAGAHNADAPGRISQPLFDKTEA